MFSGDAHRDQLRAAISETRVQARKMDLKVKVYEYFLDLLEQMGPKARVEDIYDEALPKVMEIKAKESA